MDVLIYIHGQKEPIQANIHNFNAKEFAKQLNSNLLFLDLGDYVISRDLVDMIAPAVPTDVK